MAENKTVVRNEHLTDDEDGEVDSGSSDFAPGSLVETYGNDDYSVNTSTVQAAPEVRVARKAGEIGGVVSGDGDNDVYSSGDWVKVARAYSGAYLTLLVASGTDLGTAGEGNISAGDRLVTAGGATAGCVKAYDSSNDDVGAIFAVATEAVDNSTADAGDTAEIVAEVL